MQTFKRDTEWGLDQYLFLDNNEIAARALEFGPTIKRKIGEDGAGWIGSTYEQFERSVVVGDEDLVAESEALLTEIEDQVPMSRGWRNIDDVVGAVPNVPAFLAGHPQHMRRRERTMKASAPLFIFMDLTSSAMIAASDVRRRGIALLALVRMLVEHRPVELWVGAQQGDSYKSGTIAWRIETAPLDLARAAYHIGSPAMSRGFGYPQNYALHGIPSYGPFPFNNVALHKQTGKQRLEVLFPGQEVMFIPPIYGTDPMVKDPIGWVKRVMADYVKKEED